MKFQIVKELRTENEIQRGITVKDFLFVVAFFLIALATRSLISEKLQWPYIIFTVLIGCRLTAHSLTNPGKRYYQALWILLKKDSAVYVAEKNPSKVRIKEELETYEKENS